MKASPDQAAVLDEASLARLASGIARPGYSRTAADSTVVHFGVGAFHRSHQAVYLDELMHLGGGPSWRICGVGLLESDGPVLTALRAQDHLYSVFSSDEAGDADIRVVGSLQESLWSPSDRALILTRLSDPATKIVSLTITEGGYNTHESSGEFNLDDEAIRDELADPTSPISAFGYIVEGLRRRRDSGGVPFAVLSCDNIEGNGHLLRRCILSFAGGVDDDLADWIGANVEFPSCMVDRITPVATAADAARAGELLGYTDAVPVVAEAYRQWVVEDTFPAGRPELERVGVQFVEDVRPFEMMKLRLLNGAHQALGYVAALLDFQTVHQAARDPLIHDFLHAYLMTEAAVTVPEVPGTTPADYVETVHRRLRSEFPADTVARLVEFGSDRLPKFVVPVIHARLDAGESVNLGVHVLAAWATFLAGCSESGAPLPVRDHRAVELQTLAAQSDPLALLDQRELFGNLAERDDASVPFLAAHASFRRVGVRATLTELLRASTRL